MGQETERRPIFTGWESWYNRSGLRDTQDLGINVVSSAVVLDAQQLDTELQELEVTESVETDV